MAGALVHWRADTLRKPAVSKGRRVGAGVDDHLVHSSVNLIRGHRRLHGISTDRTHRSQISRQEGEPQLKSAKSSLPTLTSVPACCRTRAASSQASSIRMMLPPSCTCRSGHTSGMAAVPTYGGRGMWSGTGRRALTAPRRSGSLLLSAPPEPCASAALRFDRVRIFQVFAVVRKLWCVVTILLLGFWVQIGRKGRCVCAPAEYPAGFLRPPRCSGPHAEERRKGGVACKKRRSRNR
jgi:hypothetical protein